MPHFFREVSVCINARYLLNCSPSPVGEGWGGVFVFPVRINSRYLLNCSPSPVGEGWGGVFVFPIRMNTRYLLHSIVEHFYLNRSFAIAQDDVIRHSEGESPTRQSGFL